MVVKLKNVRLAFSQNLFKAGVMKDGDKPAFSCSFLIPKSDLQVAEVREAIEAVAREKWEKKAPEMLKSMSATDKICLHDGDNKLQYDGFADCMYVSARNLKAPLVLDKDCTALTETSGRPYAGCYVNASVDIWAQDNTWGKRINATLRGVQFKADGDAFAGSAPASPDEFDDVGDIGEDLA